MTTVLIVEDDEVNIKLATELLEMQGFKVLQARNGNEGVRMAQEAMPHIILMDIEMPELDGIAAIKLLKSDPKVSTIKVIAVTARAMVGDEEMIRSAGADDYLSKPYRYQDLLNAVKKFC